MTIRLLADGLRRAASPCAGAPSWVCDRFLAARPRWRGPGTVQERGSVSPAPGVRSVKLARVEAALFVADEPLPAKRIAEIANLVDAAEARTLLAELQSLYEAESAFNLVPIAGGWQLRTRPEFAQTVQRLRDTRPEYRLTKPALETLAVVAYRQPITRADIEAIRGVSCSELLRQLLDRGLVRVAGHHDSLGRPILYGTTRKFLEVFGLAGLNELPLVEELRLPPEPASVQGDQPAASRSS